MKQTESGEVEAIRETTAVAPGRFQGGYLDFLPPDTQLESRCGPPRTSMLDDMCFYIQRHQNLLSNDNPDCVALFAQKIVASQYLLHSEFLSSSISYVQFHLSRQNRIQLEYFSNDFVEAQWSDMQALERRMTEYCYDIEAIMLQTSIPLEVPSTSKSMSWDDVKSDFQFLHMRFRDIRHRAEMLNSTITGLASMSGNRQASREQELSLKEARSTRALTILGLVFIPLAYTSSLFSMADPYGPGSERFWVYFATSFPLILLAVAGYYVIMVPYKNLGVGPKELFSRPSRT